MKIQNQITNEGIAEQSAAGASLQASLGAEAFQLESPGELPTLGAGSPVYAVQHFRRMRGGAQSHLLRASDGFYYICKFANNPQHVRVLANEYIATRLAQRLGIPVPERASVEVSPWLIEHTPELCIEIAGKKLPITSGLCFGSRHVNHPADESVTDYLCELFFPKIANVADFARVLVLDKWACNSDGRQCVYTRKPRERKFNVTFIDHGYCFNAGEWSFPDAPLRGVFSLNAAYQHVTGWGSFEPALSRAQTISIDDIRRCAAGIPEQWYEADADGLNRIIETLYRRRALIPQLITEFRNSSRNPFPNWGRS